MIVFIVSFISPHTLPLGKELAKYQDVVFINTIALTEERRKEFAKNVWKFAEHAKVAVRNIRRDANDEIKKCDGSEDEIKDGQNRVQKLTDKFVKEIDEIGKAKEKDIMTV